MKESVNSNTESQLNYKKLDLLESLADEWVVIDKPRITERDKEYDILFRNLNKIESGYSRYKQWIYGYYKALPCEVADNGNSYFIRLNPIH